MLKIHLDDMDAEITIIENDEGEWEVETGNCGWSYTITGYGECAFIIATQALQRGVTDIAVLLSRVDDFIKIDHKTCKWGKETQTINSMIECLWTRD